MSGLNIQEMAASAYDILMQIQNSAAELVGIDALWCRATPEPNSEDIILQEYTLTNIGLECPKIIKVLTSNGDYNPGNFTIDLFGVNYDQPLEINVTIQEWQNVFGTDSQPQQGDVVYIKLMHKLFEVRSSQVMYQIASMPTYFKCQLSKYNPTASRRQTEEFKSSVDSLTVSQEDLFGDTISQEVADVAVEVETSYNHTTYVDPLKDYDMDSVVHDVLVGTQGNQISTAYYDFNIAEKNVTYSVSASYGINPERPHWIFSCWFMNNDSDPTNREYPVRKLFLYHKDKNYWYFKIGTTLKMNIGDQITLTRGTLISVTGEVVELPNEQTKGVRFGISDMNRINKKLSGWYETGTFKVFKSSEFNIITDNNNNISISVSPDDYKIHTKFGNYKKTFDFSKQREFDKWTYLCVDFSEQEVHTIVSQLQADSDGNRFMNEFMNQTQKPAVKAGEFSFDTLSINALGTSLNIRNIRLYENEYPVGDTYKLDMESEITRNASKLILVDGPNVKSGSSFISPAR